MKPYKLALAAIAVALVPAGVVLAQAGNWNLTVEETDVSHRIGNPEAETVLTEYVSYTCSVCSKFAREGDPVLELAYIGSGKVAVEIRPHIRNAIDLVVTMLAECGEPDKFKMNHQTFMLSQSKWMAPAQGASPAQIQRWTQPGAAARRNVANDFKLYDIMEQRGYRITDADLCLNDEARAQQLIQTTLSDAREMGLRGTPSFAINGELVANAHSWDVLQPILDAEISGGDPTQE